MATAAAAFDPSEDEATADPVVQSSIMQVRQTLLETTALLHQLEAEQLAREDEANFLRWRTILRLDTLFTILSGAFLLAGIMLARDHMDGTMSVVLVVIAALLLALSCGLSLTHPRGRARMRFCPPPPAAPETRRDIKLQINTMPV